MIEKCFAVFALRLTRAGKAVLDWWSRWAMRRSEGSRPDSGGLKQVEWALAGLEDWRVLQFLGSFLLDFKDFGGF